MKLSAVTLDCADPVALAAFYQEATGWEPHPKSDEEFAGLTTPEGLFVGFQR
ncbi:MAG TPA: VOC family protein, partial [Streptomyces sp.]